MVLRSNVEQSQGKLDKYSLTVSTGFVRKSFIAYMNGICVVYMLYNTPKIQHNTKNRHPSISAGKH